MLQFNILLCDLNMKRLSSNQKKHYSASLFSLKNIWIEHDLKTLQPGVGKYSSYGLPSEFQGVWNTKNPKGHTVSQKDTVSVSHIRSPLFLQKLEFYTDKCDASVKNIDHQRHRYDYYY